MMAVRKSDPAPIDDAPIGVAATVVLLREGAAGPEVLLLERPRHRGSFAGAWVFPGGGVDPSDRLPTDAAAPAEAIEELAARRAAVREVREETGLDVSPDALVATALWIPPRSAPKRLRTWFYLAPAPNDPIVLAQDEVIDYSWLRPETALARHASTDLTLIAPTWVTLYGLQGFGAVAEIVASAQQSGLAHYETRLGASSSGPVLFWAGDVAYADDLLAEQEGGRHRLEIGQVPWVYSASERR
ncbi:MAG: NUDIX hydrolase [Cryobacterium sp.]|uniref:NUDIX hydrolase n=1 Tax=unclassified Cryobacterium TaxID=2649013 RepID=UPI0018C9064F|nr:MULTISPECIES: NUDIX hydrolase [unclassified Cryobacterium]MCY7405629.1 NUDIX hydrolase [Cryobacterium sp.]MEC5154477.1 8-oxo-dGTP pyrophosphatase MutT (NUDIX family) [Cryobacterium sp. CAN_C3]